ncbi:MAG TPA: hypothetical protein VL261_05390 [Nitrospira sp.]|jgi:hypothetical protein|nr:hypothetical protein [Nitrospira sp.]
MTDDDALHRFCQVTEALRTAIAADMALDETDQLRLENRLALLHMAYVEWKRRNLARQPRMTWNPAIGKAAPRRPS